MFWGMFLSEHGEEAMKMLVKEAVWYHNFQGLMLQNYHTKSLPYEKTRLLFEAILKCHSAFSALVDIMYLVEKGQWCDSRDTLYRILNLYRSKFYEELSKTADKVTEFKSHIEDYKAEAESLDTGRLNDTCVFRRYEKFEIEALFAAETEFSDLQNENMNIISKNLAISNKKRRCPFVEYEYGTESCKTLEIDPRNIFGGYESLLMDLSKPESSKAIDLLLEKIRLYNGYAHCMDEFAHEENTPWEQKQLLLKVCREFVNAYKAVVQLMYQVESREWCDKLDQLYFAIDLYQTDLDNELVKIYDKVTQFRDYLETYRSEGKFFRGSYLYPHHEYFQIKASLVHSRVNSDSQEENSDLATEVLSPARHEEKEVVVDDDDDYEYLFE
uniref:uncharacterized protein LOC122594154 n=1 Tax=Erigeron canadensis TaxID=72917 RepID=UPI001CB929F1|nr:uncharacterized protein LOC122594154 [Erigeron canadensis]